MQAYQNKAAADFSNLPSPQTALYNLGAGTGRDLLDNPLFQINQRNITAAEYTGSVIRTVDRWEAWRYDVEVTSNGISIAEHTEGSAGWFRQMLDIPLMGKDVTFSAIIDGELHSVTALSFSRTYTASGRTMPACRLAIVDRQACTLPPYTTIPL